MPIQFGNLDKWPGIHEFEELMLQNVDASDCARDFIFGARGGKIELHVAAARSARRRSSRSGPKAGYFTKGFNGLGYDPSWADFAKGKGVVPDQRQLADGRPEEGARQERRLLPAAAAGGQAAGDARRRGPAVGDQLEVEERRRGGDLHRLHHQRNASMQVVADNGQLTGDEGQGARCRPASTPRSSTPWKKANETDAIVPYLDWATPTMYDTITGRDPGAAGRQGDAAGVREQGPGRLLEVP